MVKSSPLHKVTDDAQWDAEDLFGRLCIFVHAAALDAGLHPSSELVPTSPWSLSCSFSVLPPQAAGFQDEVAVVVRLCRPVRRRRKGRTYMAALRVRAFVTANGGKRYMERKERIGRVALEAILSGGVDDVARRLRSPGSAGESLWKMLADAICRDLFLFACEASGVPVMPDFSSLPGDIKMAILEKLEDGKDVAMVESASKDLRDLVAEHDSHLWKAKYEAIISPLPYGFRRSLLTSYGDDTQLVRWKDRYVEARDYSSSSCFLTPSDEYEQIPAISAIETRIIRRIIRDAMILLRMSARRSRRSIVRKAIQETWKPETDIVRLVAQRRAAVEENKQRKSAGRTVSIVSKGSYRKEHQAGAVHSPSSGYHWKHR